MTLVIEARRLPLATISSSAAIKSVEASGWASLADTIENFSVWDQCLLAEVVPLVREGLRRLGRPNSPEQEEEVKIVCSILKGLQELEAAYHSMKDQREHLEYLKEDREQGGGDGAGGDYSWWPTDDDFRTTEEQKKRTERLEELQMKTGLSAVEENYFEALLNQCVKEQELDRLFNGDIKPTGNEQSESSKEFLQLIPEGMNPNIDISMVFDLTRGGECTGIGSSDVFGGHGLHFEDEEKAVISG